MKIEDKICSLIPSSDFQKAVLLTAISKEEGANFIEIRVNLEEDLSVLKNLSDNKFKLIFSIEPNQINLDNEEEIIAKIKQLVEYEPDAIEINLDLSQEKIIELSNFVKKQGIKIHLAKYLTEKTKIMDIRKIIKDMVKLKAETIKIVAAIETDIEALEFFSLYNKFSKHDLLLVPSGETNKLAQLLTVFFGAKYTYGYISRKSSEALLPINILKRNLELLNETTENKLFQK